MQQLTLLDGIQDYWAVRSDSYSRQNLQEMNNWKRRAWREKILAAAPAGDRLSVLDVGTGPGFFAINLALAGHQVTGLDVTEEMLHHARENAMAYGAAVRLVRQSGDCLPFPGSSFDLVVSRNVLWNLEKPEQALKEWCRVLRPGGRLVYFDANWYLYLFDGEIAAQRERLRQEHAGGDEPPMPAEKVRMLEDIARKLPLSCCRRPDWDRRALEKIGMKEIRIQEDIGPDVLSQQEQLAYQPNPMFMVCAEKGGGSH